MVTGSWQLTEERVDHARLAWQESLFALANGGLGTRGDHEEGHPRSRAATFLHGVFVAPPGGTARLAAVPAWTRWSVTVDGEQVDVHSRPLVGYRRTLDLRTGVLTRSYLWKGAQAPVVRMTWRRVLPLQTPALAAADVMVEALHRPVDVVISTGLDAAAGSPDAVLWRVDDWPRMQPDALLLDATSVDGRRRLRAATKVRTRGAEPRGLTTDAAHPVGRFAARVEPGQPLVMEKLAGYGCARADEAGARPPDPLGPEGGGDDSFDGLAAASADRWRERWTTAAIEIDGDADAELAVHVAAFHLLAAASRDNPRGGLGARLLSGFGYDGHVFWDTDAFITPWLSTVAPELAATQLRYRHLGLPAAREKARRLGRRGAFFAWEADDVGEDATPDEWIPSPGAEPVPVWTGRIEEHHVAAIGWAVDHHHRWTGDDALLVEAGAELIASGAAYWAGRVEVDADGSGHLRDVIGPDEYHVHVDDNAYTNMMAAWHLRRAAALIDRLEEGDPAVRQRVLGRSGLHDDPAALRRLADCLVVPRRPDGLIAQFDGWFDLETVDQDAWQPRLRRFEQFLPDEWLQAHQLAKQADVVMISALLGRDGPGPIDHGRHFDWYEPRCEHGSSLSFATHAQVAFASGRSERGHDLLRRAISVDLDDLLGRGGEGIHAATQGGILQAVVFGAAGVHLGEDGPRTRPQLPEQWSAVRCSVLHHGRRYDLEAT